MLPNPHTLYTLTEDFLFWGIDKISKSWKTTGSFIVVQLLKTNE